MKFMAAELIIRTTKAEYVGGDMLCGYVDYIKNKTLLTVIL